MNSGRRIKGYVAFAFLGIVALAVIYVSHLGSAMHTRAKFTIGYLEDYVYHLKNGKHYRFHFQVQGTVYQGTEQSQAGMDRRVGARFIVEYDSLDPTQHVGYFPLAVPDSIVQAPANGWREPPFPMPQWILDRVKKKE
jgi:hypothetical protein